jgi:hypothetical protein
MPTPFAYQLLNGANTNVNGANTIHLSSPFAYQLLNGAHANVNGANTIRLSSHSPISC